MTTKVTTIARRMLELMALALPEHQQLSNPYDLEKSTDLELEQGWGVRFGSSTAEERETCKFSEDRALTIVLTRRMDALKTDDGKRLDRALDLLEDAAIVKRALHIQKLQAAGAANLTGGGDSGIQTQLRGDGSQHFIYVELTYELTLFESYTA